MMTFLSRLFCFHKLVSDDGQGKSKCLHCEKDLGYEVTL
jgi:hypothetical protein